MYSKILTQVIDYYKSVITHGGRKRIFYKFIIGKRLFITDRFVIIFFNTG